MDGIEMKVGILESKEPLAKLCEAYLKSNHIQARSRTVESEEDVPKQLYWLEHKLKGADVFIVDITNPRILESLGHYLNRKLILTSTRPLSYYSPKEIGYVNGHVFLEKPFDLKILVKHLRNSMYSE